VTALNKVKQTRSIAIIGNQGYSLINFRGELMKSLIRHGLAVYALAPDISTEQEERLRALGATPIIIRLSRSGTNPIRDLADTVHLAIRLKALAVDAVFCYFAKPVIYGTFAAVLSGVHRRYSLIAGLGYAFTDVPGKPAMKKGMVRILIALLYRCALAANDVVFFQNPDDLEQFVQSRLVRRARAFRVNGTGVDLQHFSNVSLPDTICFCLAARMIAEKGIREFVEAARIVRTGYPSTRFVLLGGTDNNPSAISEEEIKKWVDEGIVEWPGHVSDIRDWFQKSSVFVLPSYREGVPRSTQEAMAMSRPVITTDVPGCRETVVDGFNGFLIPPRDPEALAIAMVRFVKEPALIIKMGNNSRKLAEQKFDVYQINHTMLNVMGFK
jgi:glycosyltransferase involved in cell wall biosynthesis